MATKLKDIPFETMMPTIVPASTRPARDETYDPDKEDPVAVIGARNIEMLSPDGCYIPVIAPDYSGDPYLWYFYGTANYACYSENAYYACMSDYANCADCALYANSASFAECAGIASWADCAGCVESASFANRLGCLDSYCDSASIYTGCDGLYFEYKDREDGSQIVSKLFRYGEVGSLPTGAKVLYFT